MDLDRLGLAELDSSLLQPAQAAPKLLDGGGKGPDPYPTVDASRDAAFASVEGSTPSSLARSLHLRDTGSAVGAPTWARTLLKSSSSAATDRISSHSGRDTTPLPSKPPSTSADASGTRSKAQLAPDSEDALAIVASFATFAVIALVLVAARPAFCVHVDAQGKSALRWDVILVFSLLSAMLTWFACAWLP